MRGSRRALRRNYALFSKSNEHNGVPESLADNLFIRFGDLTGSVTKRENAIYNLTNIIMNPLIDMILLYFSILD